MRKSIGNSIVIQQILTTALGSTDTTTAQDAVVPGPNATLRQASFTLKTTTADTGTFSVQIMRGTAGATAVSAPSSGTFIASNAAVNSVPGQIEGGPTDPNSEGDRLWIKTVKTGTVATGNVLLVVLTWML